MKMNCWEFCECGREPGGRNAERLSVCQATLDGNNDGTNDGKNGGRYCWATVGTMSKLMTNCNKAQNIDSCVECHFFKLVKAQEGEGFCHKGLMPKS